MTKVSWLRGADPISKVCSAILMTTVLVSTRDLLSAFVLSAISVVVMYALSRPNIKAYYSLFSVFSGGALVLVLFQSLVRPGEGIEFASIHLSKEGAILGVALVIRTIGIIACSVAFASSTQPKDLVTMLVKFGIPFRIAFLLYLGLRFIPVFEQDARSIADAYKLRNEGGLFKRFKMSIVSLLAIELRRVEETTIALEVRGFGRHNERTTMEEISLNVKGVVLLCGTAFLTCAVLTYRLIN